MIQSVNFPICDHSIQPYGTWENLKKRIYALGLDGIEAISVPGDSAAGFLPELVSGYHMTFFHDWLDFWRQDEEKLLRKFGSWETVEKIYNGRGPEVLFRKFKDDLARGQSFHTPYMVFHVSDVSIEENYTYNWEHTDWEVLDGAIEFLNHILWHVEPDFDILLENQWWPGFKFTEPEKTEYLLSHIEYPRVGIMLDTGHLMNANTAIRNQEDGIAWVLENIEKHGELSKRIYGLHFHQSVSGRYVLANTGSLPPDYTDDYFENFAISYPHIQLIDRHLPWTNPDCVKILDTVQPKYLTHELSYGPNRPQLAAVKRQLGTIRKGYQR